MRPAAPDAAPAPAPVEDPQDAREEATRRLSEQRPRDPSLRAELARISFSRRRWDEAVLRQREALALGPESSTTAAALGAYLAVRTAVMGPSLRTRFPASGISIQRRGAQIEIELAEPACLEVLALARSERRRVGLLWARTRAGERSARGPVHPEWPEEATLELAQLADCAAPDPVFRTYAHAPAEDAVP